MGAHILCVLTATHPFYLTSIGPTLQMEKAKHREKKKVG